ncbi:MAG: hypothetical protein KIT34_06735 [Cyanobacteria bacterium TGS_CYA1]|nr:hypothetical protein [Cyanobacteria bacterium TGS_CYA1]
MALGLILATIFTPPAFGESGALSIYGEPLSEAYKKDFFSFFRFSMIGMSVTKDGYTSVSYKPPRGSMLRQCVDLNLTLTSEGRIKRMVLKLRRRCIEDSRQGMFARDVAKSFIQAGIPERDSDSVSELINEIFFRQKLTQIDVKPKEDSAIDSKLPSITVLKLGGGDLSDGDIVIFGENLKVPELSKEPSPLYKVFAGESKLANQDIGDLVLEMENKQGEEDLSISVMGKQDKEKMQKSDFDFDQLPGTAVPLLK